MSLNTLFAKRMARKVSDEELESANGGSTYVTRAPVANSSAAGGGLDYGTVADYWFY